MADLIRNKNTGEYGYRAEDGRIMPVDVQQNVNTGEMRWKPKGEGQDWTTVKPKPKQGMVSGAIDAATTGATLGFGDELTALEAGLLGRTPDGNWFDYSQSFGQRYEDALQAERTQQAQFREDNPLVGTVAEITGAIASPVNKVAAPLMAAPTLAGRLGRATAVGAGTGAVAGAGGAEGNENILQEAGQGAVLGGAFGGVGTGAIEAGSKVLSPIANMALDRLPFRQSDAAARRVAYALQSDEITPQDALARIQSMPDEGALMDVGENLQGAARAVHSIPGEGRTRITDFLARRQEGTRPDGGVLPEGSQFGRVQNIISDLVPENYNEIRLGTQQERQALGPIYEAAKNEGAEINLSGLAEDLGEGIKDAKGPIRDNLRRIDQYIRDDEGNLETSIRALHNAKMAIDDLMTGDAKTSMGKVSKDKVRDYQDQLVAAIEGAGEAGQMYRTGRLGTAAQWRIDEAIDDGLDFMKKSKFRDAQSVWDKVSKMSAAEQSAFKSGVAQWMREQMGAPGFKYTHNAAGKISGSPAVEQKLKAVFNDDELRRFIDALDAEGQMYGSYSTVRGGSPTARIEADQDSIMQDPGRLGQGLSDILSGNSMAMARGFADVGGALYDRAALPPGVSGRMANMLTGRLVPEDMAALQNQMLRIDPSREQRGRLARALMMGTTTGYN